MLGRLFRSPLIGWGFGFWPRRWCGSGRRGLSARLSSVSLLRRLVGAELAQVLVTLGLSFMVGRCVPDVMGGDPIGG